MAAKSAPTITINQDIDTPARREVLPGAALTYLYDRSRDSKRGSTVGQDFIAYRCHEDHLVFAVCDGVSQSFYGDLAARFLGEKLVAWLDSIDPGQGNFDLADFSAEADRVLRAWTAEATALVQAKSLSSTLAPMLRDALDRKRENGSESMFVAGRVDLIRKRLAVCWMGDMRLWLWDADGRSIDLPGAAWETKERWSSRLGPKNGIPRTAIISLTGIDHITIHSDGVGSRAPELKSISLPDLNQIAQDLSAAPTSDDISILDIALEVGEVLPALPAPELSQPDPAEPVIRWTEVDGAERYRVEVETDQRQWTIDVTNTTFFVPRELGQSAVIQVQALSNDHASGLWSTPFVIGKRIAPQIATAMPVVAYKREVPAPTSLRFGLILACAWLLAVGLSCAWLVLRLGN